MRIENQHLFLKVTRSKHIPNSQSFNEVLGDAIRDIQETSLPSTKGTTKPHITEAILQEVRRSAHKYGVPQELILAIIQQESSFNPMAYNKNKDGTEDRGLMQVNYQHNIKLMKEYGIEDPNQLYDIKTNIEIGTRILYENYKNFKDWIMAVKAYNGIRANNWEYVKSVFEKISLYR